MTRERETVIIIGGGACGLKAAKILSKDRKVILLEANTRLGGRIHTSDAGGFSIPMERGAEFIHGDLRATMKLLKKAGISYEPHEGSIVRVRNGHWEAMDEGFEGWDDLLRKMKRARQDMSLQEFLDIHFPGDEYAALRSYASDFAEGFNLADTHMASIKSLYAEWTTQQETTYTVNGGYAGLIDYLQDECRRRGVEIHTGNRVVHIDWKPGEVSARTMNGETFLGSRAIVTVPAGILQGTRGGAAISFDPVPAEHLNAFRQVGYGPVIKVILEFREPFWKSRREEMAFLLSNNIIPTWWPRSINSHHFLVGWKGGPQVLSLVDHDEASILQLSLESLSSIFQIPRMGLEDLLIHGTACNWQKNEFAEGGYSYSLPESGRAKEILNTPVEDTLYFAGEALYDGKAGATVEAALLSGRAVARRVRAKK